MTHLYILSIIAVGAIAICAAAIILGALFGAVLPALFGSEADAVRWAQSADVPLPVAYWKCARCGMCLTEDYAARGDVVVCGGAACPMLYVDERGEVHMEPPPKD